MEGQKKRPLGSAATDQSCLLQKHLETRLRCHGVQESYQPILCCLC